MFSAQRCSGGTNRTCVGVSGTALPLQSQAKRWAVVSQFEKPSQCLYVCVRPYHPYRCGVLFTVRSTFFRNESAGLNNFVCIYLCGS